MREEEMTLTGILRFACFFLIPFLGGNHLALPYITVDRFWIETSFLLLLTSGVVATFLQNKRADSHFNGFLLFASPFLMVSTLSLVYTWNLYNTAKELNMLVWAVGAVYLYSITADKAALFRGLVWGSVFCVVAGMLQLKVLFPQLSSIFLEGRYAWMLHEKPVPFVSFLNENMFGGYLLLTLPISLFFGFHEKRRPYVFTSLIIATGLLMSLSRLSFVIMCLEFIAVSSLLVRQVGWRSILTLSGTAAVAVGLFFALVYVHGSAGKNIMQNSLQGKTMAPLAQAKTLNYRTEIWQGGANAFRARPALGHGAGTFEYAFRKYSGGGLYTKYAHGGIVKIAAELGIAGLAAYFWYLFGTGLGIRRKGFFRPFFTLAFLGGFLFSLVDFALDTPAFVVTLFVLSAVFIMQRKTQKTGATRMVFAAAVVLLIASFAFTGRVGFAKKAIEEGVLFEETGLTSNAIASYQEAADVMPLDNEPYIRIVGLLARSLEKGQEQSNKEGLKKAINYYLEQIRWKKDADSELFFVAALAYRVRGNKTKADEYMTRAIDLYPSMPYYVSQAVDWSMREGDFAQAHILIGRFEPYLENIRLSGNPHGLYVFRLRELEAEIAYRRGNVEEAVALARNNLLSAQKDEFVIASYKTREFVRKEWLVRHLAEQVNSYDLQARKLHHGGS